MPHLPKKTNSPLREDKIAFALFTGRLDVQNANTIFLIRRIRGCKTITELRSEKYENEYSQVKAELYDLEMQIKNHPKALFLEMRRMSKRCKYLQEYLKTERDQKSRLLLKEHDALRAKERATALNKPDLRINAKALAAFIVAESLKLTKQFKPLEGSLFRMSTIPDSEFSDPQLLAAVLRGEASFPSLTEVSNSADALDALEGMDEAL